MKGGACMGTRLGECLRHTITVCQTYSQTHGMLLIISYRLFECQNHSSIHHILGSNSVCFHHFPMLPFDWYVLGYCIAHSSCDWELESVNCELESVKAFLNLLGLQQGISVVLVSVCTFSISYSYLCC